MIINHPVSVVGVSPGVKYFVGKKKHTEVIIILKYKRQVFLTTITCQRLFNLKSI